jgi:phosphoribosylaminoimidazolecarboxamide formyltransferase/IMP cyclohydrolase
MSRLPVTRAVVSVSDRTGLEDFARRLHAAGVEIVSSGGTAAALAKAGVPVTLVSSVTGAPEMLGGRVKTLHPRIHGGILADLGSREHLADLEQHGIAPFQLVVVNLYPFEQTVTRPGATPEEVVEQIDVGGPAMVRAAAKNHAWVGVVTSPAQYAQVAEAVEAGGLDLDLRRSLARAAFFTTAAYDAAIVRWLEGAEPLPERMVVALERVASLRYGENPHQEAALYRERGREPWWATTRLLQGKEMSFNNYADAEAARRQVGEHLLPACVIVKHTNPCGVAVAPTLEQAFRLAWECDPVSAFGSVVALNRPLDEATARAMVEAGFIEVVVAPEVDGAAASLLAARANLRVLAVPTTVPATELDLRRVEGGFLAQTPDRVETEGWQVVTSRAPTASEWDDLDLAWKVAAHTKSNAIVVARAGQAVGIGAGDQSRVGAAERAVRQAGDRARGGSAASDAFFPFADGLEVLASAGVTAVVQPGGSRGDEAVIAAAEQRGMALVLTGRRHFRH